MTFSFFEIKYLYEKRGKVGFGVTEKELAELYERIKDSSNETVMYHED